MNIFGCEIGLLCRNTVNWCDVINFLPPNNIVLSIIYLTKQTYVHAIIFRL
ncbi:hypothetical protein KUTeg_021062 [Tegillarca granosa]|uniref:Uncharacterized protein n=1 Tax=Tegillarca granosa TaxID=220873 RepID=A0ABQ9EA80_TEGGR|nr:hypothetical protein KUTeg_021062 [Tegillarca granosa]